MKWMVTVLLFVFLGNSRGGEYNNPVLLAYKEELEEFFGIPNLRSEVSKEVIFNLYTRDGPVEGEVLVLNNADILQSSFFNPENRTKFVIHGFMDSSYHKMAQTLKNEFLFQEEVNVILVDWSKIARAIDYIHVARKTVAVGILLAHFMEFLLQNEAKLDDFHLIGHSLGAHVAGFAGGALGNGTVSRITGLDPALPGFYQVSPESRLDRSNAKFVDCIHTCAGTLGLREAICSADFYPNGGMNMQPGCPFYDFGQCSHIRSFEFFIESTNPKHEFLTESCPSLPVKDHSQCKPSTVKMGYYVSTSAKGIFYGVTNSQYPFAVISD